MWPRLLIHWGLVHPGLAYCRNHPSQMFFSVLLPLPKPSSSYFWLSLWFPPERMRTGLSYSQLRIAAKKRNLTICRFASPLKLLSLLKLRYRILLILGYHINQESCHQSCGRFFLAQGTGRCDTRSTFSPFSNPCHFLRLPLLSSNRGDPRAKLRLEEMDW